MTDALARQRAVDPTRSCIVQAPAGSGKTELLIQRYLGLLSQVKTPEEILAITYTRKATEEMRMRITQALVAAQREAPADIEPHQQQTRGLALAVLAQDTKQQWRLLDFPRRLRISTIDSFCANLVRQMPFLSRMGAMPQILEPATAIYEEAVHRMLSAGLRDARLGEKIKQLLGHMDNDWRSIEHRLVRALMARDQWLGHVLDAKEDTARARRQMTEFLERQVLSKTTALDAYWVHGYRERIDTLVDYIRRNKDGVEGWWSPWPSSAHENVTLEAYQGLYQLLFVGGGKKRKAVNTNTGFPAAKDAQTEGSGFTTADEAKAACKALIEELHDSGFARELKPIEHFPHPAYTDTQWRIVELLMELLHHAVLQLRLVNHETGQVDFVEMALAARMALGSETEPTDLLLHLDHQIQHILIDEFQDTSRAQVELFTQLILGWGPGDGRSLFIVGDPMQSIYAFRKADVGNYLRAKEYGMGDIQLERLQLQRNFRSRPGIVRWVNNVFAEVFPKNEDIILGKVSYAESVPARAESDEALVQLHLMEEASLMQESQEALRIIEERMKQGLNNEEKIAVLVRSRGRLKELVPLLNEKKIPFAAVDIFELSQEPIIQDLQSLSCALHYLYDRQAWLALLRSPLCGLSLKSLTILSEHKRELLWNCLGDEELIQKLDSDEQVRVKRLFEVIQVHLHKGPQKSLRAYIEGVFHYLGGPGLYAEQELLNANVFFNVLEEMENQAGGFSKTHLKNNLKELKAPSSDVNAPVQLMTIHKSKGLEFDTVVLLGLGAAPRANEYELLAHFEWCLSQEQKGLLFAPIHATGEDKDPIQKLIRHLRHDQEANEVQRLLYVAATRAKNYLHLIAKGKRDKQGEAKWDKGSLMEILGPPLSHLGLVNLQSMEEETQEEVIQIPWLRRAASLKAIEPPKDPWPMARTTEDSVDLNMGFDASLKARHVGIVVHQYLEWMGKDALAQWTHERLVHERPHIERLLLKEGMGVSDLNEATSQAMESLMFVLQDTHAQWILGPHQEAHCEWALCGLSDQDQMQNMIIDRSFVDEKGTRWIIDYKTGRHQGGDLQSYLKSQKEKHQRQLEKYAKALFFMEKRPIKIGLYFPFEDGFLSWDWDAEAS